MCCLKYHTKPFILNFEILKYLIPFDGLRIILPDTLTGLQLDLELPQGNFSFFFSIKINFILAYALPVPKT